MRIKLRCEVEILKELVENLEKQGTRGIIFYNEVVEYASKLESKHLKHDASGTKE